MKLWQKMYAPDKDQYHLGVSSHCLFTDANFPSKQAERD
jgi:hypothetical protein